MRTARVTTREAQAVVDGLGEGVFAVEGYCPDGLTESAIDALIASVDAELAATEEAAAIRVQHSFTDARRAHRARRRVEGAALRAVPGRFEAVAAEPLGEAA
ncbi:hypothetical protein [Amycolatopsis benzoatilytica]|uniref:hypothetical protein n=1 Tax=Amycolatopsis benzoatilytica TaxID=346045 RepID=UPI00039EB173|nr:hypothetical protein [Amycolatopsis benzoatilytica]